MGKTTVALVSGDVVDSSSEAWRIECEARHLLRMPKDARSDAMAAREKIRGKAAADDLMAVMRAVYDDAKKRRDDGKA